MSRNLLPITLTVGVEFCLRGNTFVLKGKILLCLIGHKFKISHCSYDSSGIWRNDPNQILESGTLGILFKIVKSYVIEESTLN